MGSFFKRKRKENAKKMGKESAVESNDLFGDDRTAGKDEVNTELYFSPNASVTDEEKYYFQFLHNELKPLKENQLSIAGIDLVKDEGEWVVMAFLRNSLDRGVEFSDTPLVLMGPDGDLLAKKTFQLADIGEIPARSSVPWRFVFQQSEMEKEEIPATGWQLAFEIKPKHRLDLEEAWEKSLAEKDKEILRQVVENAAPLKEGEVNFLGIQAKLLEDGLHVTLLIRNGSDKNVQLEQLPLIVQDGQGDEIAQGGFKLDNFTVKANTSKPWTFIFPKDLVTKENPDLSTWRAYPPQQ